MTTCELVGCSFFAQGQCNFYGSECPTPRKAIADGLVGALEDIITEVGTSTLANTIATDALALLKQGDKPKQPGKLHHCSGAGMSKERLEEMRHDEEDIKRTEFEREEE